MKKKSAVSNNFWILFLLLCTVASISCSFPRPGTEGFFNVTTGGDAEDNNVGDGLCRSTLPGGACTLRAAIQESNALAGENTIQLGHRTHRLTLPDHLLVTDTVRLSGAGMSASIVDGMDRGGRIFMFDGSLAWLTDMTLTGGGPTVASGGAIYIDNRASVSLVKVSIRDSEAFTGGGGIVVSDGSLILLDSMVSGNTATGAFAGAIWISTNGTLIMDRSTVDDNSSNRCGGIYNYGTLKATNSTISGNSARSDGRGTGGMININSAFLNNMTIYDNISNAPVGDTQSSGGLLVTRGARTTLSNSILAGNTRRSTASDCTGEIVSNGYNLIQITDGCTLTDILTGNVTDRDPQLRPLAFNFGAATRSHLPAGSSPAVNAGHPQVGAGVSTRGRCEARDQANRIRQLTGSGRRCDIGSIEAR